MSYHPIHDVWFMARPKLKGGATYYGAYPSGFLGRARRLIGAGINTPVLHACGGLSHKYQWADGYGNNDRRLDIDPTTNPDFTQDARDEWQLGSWQPDHVLLDPPYSEDDAEHYNCGSSVYPKPTELLKRAVAVLPQGGRVGILHYVYPPPVAGLCDKPVAVVPVMMGFHNKARVFTVYERE